MQSSRFLWTKIHRGMRIFAHESLPMVMVMLGASPLKIGALSPTKNPVKIPSRAPKVKVELSESGHVECTLSEIVCSWLGLVKALSVKLWRRTLRWDFGKLMYSSWYAPFWVRLSLLSQSQFVNACLCKHACLGRLQPFPFEPFL